MDSWKNVVKSVLLGLDTDEEVLEYYQQKYQSMGLQIDATEGRELRILKIAALRYQMQKGAQVAVKVEDPIFEKAAKEHHPYCSAKRMQQLKIILKGQLDPLLGPFLDSLIANNQIVQAAALPYVLDKIKNDPSLYSKGRKAGGYRIVWLAKMRKEWAYILTKNYQLDDFEYGEVDDRIGYFQQLRQSDAAAALQLLQNTWDNEAHPTKVKLLRCLSDNLGEKDIDFLESVLYDKRKPVRRTAADLLSKVKNSPYVDRMQKRLESCLFFDESLMNYKLQDSHLQLCKAMKRDGIELSKGSTNTTILLQLLAKTPLEWWQSTLKMSIPALLNWTQSQALFKTILSGWLSSALHFNNHEVLIQIHYLYVNKLQSRVGWKSFEQHFQYESSDNVLFNQYIRHYFDLKNAKIIEDNEPLVQLLLQENRLWDQDNALLVIACIQFSIQKNTHVFHWNLKTVLKRAAYAVPLSIYNQVKTDWPSHAQAWQSWEKEVLNFLDMLLLRGQIAYLKD